MKKSVIMLLCGIMIFPLVLQGQRKYAIDRGSLIASGSAGFRIYNDDQDWLTNFSFSPNLQYFIIPNLAVGGSIDVDYLTRYYNQGSHSFSRTIFGIGPAITYYIGKAGSRLYPFFHASAYISYLASESGTENWLNSFSFSGGLAFPISKNVALTGEAYYSYGKPKDFPGQHEIGLSFGLATFIY